MFSFLRQKIVLGVVNAAKRGNPVAQRLVARETRAFLRTLPVSSPIVPGPYEIPDLERPLSEAMQTPLVGEFETKPLPTTRVTPAMLVGRRVEALSTVLGTYGMGGFGWFGLMLDSGVWFVVPIFGASEWIELDRRILEAPGCDGGTAWISDGDDEALMARLCGATILGAELQAHSLELRFDNKARLAIEKSSRGRAPLAGTRQPRVFLDGDDLRTAVFFSPSAEIHA
ncbi:hypothetical protein ACN2XU_21405 [Primorskyibacter sp. 2E107]|uniref:hypothetical protein n=1 Tax=Primorskyibacter sp. 2E107 TaxID=3403458 RepID=UPI003AF7CCAB